MVGQPGLDCRELMHAPGAAATAAEATAAVVLVVVTIVNG